MKKLLVVLFSLGGLLLFSGCNNTAMTEQVSFDDAYQTFVNNIMQDKVEQVTAVLDWKATQTSFDMTVSVDNDAIVGNVSVDSVTTASAMQSSGGSSIYAELESDFLTLSGRASFSQFVDNLVSYYRLNDMDFVLGGLLAGGLQDVDLIKQQIQEYQGQRFSFNTQDYVSDSVNMSSLTSSLKRLPLDVYHSLQDSHLFDMQSVSDDAYIVTLSSGGLVDFGKKLLKNEYVHTIVSSQGGSGDVSEEDIQSFVSTLMQLNDITVMKLVVHSKDQVDLEVTNKEGSEMSFVLSLGQKKLDIEVQSTTGDNFSFDFHTKETSALHYNITANVHQGDADVFKVHGTYSLGLEDDSMSVDFDVDISILNALLNLPIDDEYIVIHSLFHSVSKKISNEVIELTPPSNAQEFVDFFGGNIASPVDVAESPVDIPSVDDTAVHGSE